MIWLDVDCVIADFMAYVEKDAGVAFDRTFDYYELDREVERLGGKKFWTWRSIRWAEINPTPWARELVLWAKTLGEVGYITACVHPDRKIWLDWFDPEAVKVFTERKSYVVRDDLLIDDYPYPGNEIRCPAKWWHPMNIDVMTYIKVQYDLRCSQKS